MGCAPTPIVALRRVSSVLYEKSCYVKIAGVGKDLIQEAIDVNFTAPRAARDEVLANLRLGPYDCCRE
jgi:hypothetical protein